MFLKIPWVRDFHQTFFLNSWISNCLRILKNVKKTNIIFRDFHTQKFPNPDIDLRISNQSLSDFTFLLCVTFFPHFFLCHILYQTKRMYYAYSISHKRTQEKFLIFSHFFFVISCGLRRSSNNCLKFVWEIHFFGSFLLSLILN